MRKLLISLYIGLFLLLCFVGTNDKIVYSHGNLRWIPFIIMIVAQPVVLYLLLLQFSFNVRDVHPKLVRRGITAASIAIFLLSYVFFQQFKKENDLALHGQMTKGIVYKKWYDDDKKNPKWLLRCNYIVDGTSFSTFSETDKENKYRIGDTLTVIYSTRYPQNSIIYELKEN